MATTGERVFAWVGVGVAVLSAVALSVAVIVQQITTDKNSASTSPVLTCVDNSTEQTLPVPDKFVATLPVTQLAVTDISVGNGVAAKANDCLIVKYYGTLADGGTMFDENFTKPTAFAFTLGQGQVIKGWDEGLLGMRVGGERRLVIPSSLGYGSQSSGVIPPNAALVFDVRLLRIQ